MTQNYALGSPLPDIGSDFVMNTDIFIIILFTNLLDFIDVFYLS